MHIDPKQLVGQTIKLKPSGHRVAYTIAKLLSIDGDRATVIPKGHRHSEQVPIDRIQPWKKGLALNDQGRLILEENQMPELTVMSHKPQLLMIALDPQWQNPPLFWRKDSRGFTEQLAQAHVFDHEKASKQSQTRVGRNLKYKKELTGRELTVMPVEHFREKFLPSLAGQAKVKAKEQGAAEAACLDKSLGRPETKKGDFNCPPDALAQLKQKSLSLHDRIMTVVSNKEAALKIVHSLEIQLLGAKQMLLEVEKEEKEIEKELWKEKMLEMAK
jgi:hypothetical protein